MRSRAYLYQNCLKCLLKCRFLGRTADILRATLGNLYFYQACQVIFMHIKTSESLSCFCLLHILVLPHCEDLNLPPPEPATPEYLTWDHCTKLPELPVPAPAPSSWPPSSLTALGTLDPAPELLPPPSSPHFSWSVRARSLVGVWRVDFKGITSRGEKKKS